MSGALGMKKGDRVVHILSGRRGVAVDFLQDGDAYVDFDDGGPSEVKWNHLMLEKAYRNLPGYRPPDPLELMRDLRQHLPPDVEPHEDTTPGEPANFQDYGPAMILVALVALGSGFAIAYMIYN